MAFSHDRAIINIKPEHVDAWLNPDSAVLAALYRVLDDKQHLFYEHRIAARSADAQDACSTR